MFPILMLLRRSASWWVVPPVVVLYGVALSRGGSPWRGDLAWAFETVGAIVMFVGALYAGAVALEIGRDRSGWGPVMESLGPRARTHPVMRAVAALSVAVGVHLAVLVVTTVMSVTAPVSSSQGSAKPIITQLLALGSACVFGMFCGTQFAGTTAALVASSGFLALEYLDYGGVLPLGLAEHGASAPLFGLEYSQTHFVWRSVWMLGFMAAILVWSLGKPWKLRGMVVVGGAVVALGISSVFVDSSPVFLASRDQPGYCVGTKIVVCGFEYASPVVTDAQAVAESAATIVQKELGVVPPSRYDLWWSAVPEKRNFIIGTDQNFPGRRATLQQVLVGIVAPSSCPGWYSSDGPPPEAAFAASDKLVTWLAHHRSLVTKGFVTSVEAGNSTGDSPAADVTYLKNAARALASCTLDEVPSAT